MTTCLAELPARLASGQILFDGPLAQRILGVRVGFDNDCDALFNTFCFLFVFLPVVLAVYWSIPRRGGKLAWLTLSSFVFYGFWDVRFVLLLIASAAVDFVAGLRMSRPGARRRVWLVASMTFNLGMLGFFKYAGFFTTNARSLFDLAGLGLELPAISVVLPVGISFYTFQTMSYTIDVYRGDVEHTRSFLKYLTYVTMFPQLVAGPIVRYRTVADQLDQVPRRPRAQMFASGFTLFVIGLAKKVLVADTIASRIDPIWADTANLTAGAGWAAALGYSLQLYYDFSGYSDMAIGIGGMLGFVYPVNFRAPYKALNPSDFWTRWHVTLSTFLRDYLYIPLGGNRHGAGRTHVNVMVVMLLGGLWHGAAWTFVIWGAYHGLLIVVYRWTRSIWDAAPKVVQRLWTFFLVVVGWVTFRAPDMATALDVYGAMFLDLVPTDHRGLLAGLAAAVVATMLLRSTAEMRFALSTRRALVVGALFVASAVALASNDSPFLYYQF